MTRVATALFDSQAAELVMDPLHGGCGAAASPDRGAVVCAPQQPRGSRYGSHPGRQRQHDADCGLPRTERPSRPRRSPTRLRGRQDMSGPGLTPDADPLASAPSRTVAGGTCAAAGAGARLSDRRGQHPDQLEPSSERVWPGVRRPPREPVSRHPRPATTTVHMRHCTGCRAAGRQPDADGTYTEAHDELPAPSVPQLRGGAKSSCQTAGWGQKKLVHWYQNKLPRTGSHYLAPSPAIVGGPLRGLIRSAVPSRRPARPCTYLRRGSAVVPERDQGVGRVHGLISSRGPPRVLTRLSRRRLGTEQSPSAGDA